MDLQTTIDALLTAFVSSPVTPDRVSEYRWKLMVLFSTQQMDYHRFTRMLTDAPLPIEPPSKRRARFGEQ